MARSGIVGRGWIFNGRLPAGGCRRAGCGLRAGDNARIPDRFWLGSAIISPMDYALLIESLSAAAATASLRDGAGARSHDAIPHILSSIEERSSRFMLVSR